MEKLIKNKGFTLIELMLVISVGIGISFVSFQGLVQKQENIQSYAAGQQLQQVGLATNNYIGNHYDTISTLSNSTGSSTDPGPRTCNTSSSSCTITIQTLINEGFLSPTYGNTNIYGAGYNILLKRSGSSPYYNLTGLVLTNKPWVTGSATKIRYDLLGNAMQAAGIDSAMSRTSPTILEGYKGNWSTTVDTYSIINQQGLLGYQVGFGSNAYSLFLRRDGSLPMTGALNMGANDINNAKNINASGTMTAGGAGIFGGEVTATNGYGDKITIGGDNAGSDYEIRLNSPKPLSIFSPNLAGSDRPNTTVFQTNGQMRVIGNTLVDNNIITSGFTAANLPSGWSGGVLAPDFYGVGGFYLSKGDSPSNKNWSFTALNNGNVTNTGNISSGGKIATQGLNPNELPPGFGAGGVRTVDVIATGSFYSIQTGTNISDGKFAFYARQDGNVQNSGNMTVGGRLTTNELLQLNTVVSMGAGCSPNGLVGRDSNGTILNCSSGVWSSAFRPIITTRDDGQWGSDADVQYCNNDEYVVGGGGNCQDPAHHFIHDSYPTGNGWFVNCMALPGYSDLPAHALATCMKK